MRGKDLKPIERCMAALEKLLGPEVLAQAKSSPQKVKERAIHHFVNAGTNGTEHYFLERTCCMAICDVANGGNLGLFTISFPYIEDLISAKTTT